MNSGVIKTTVVSLATACLLQFFFQQIQSDFVFVFLKSNITNLQVALLAVNTATLGIVLTKIKELVDKSGERAAFDSTKKEMLLSIKEQVVLVATSLVVIAIESAKAFPFSVPEFILHSALTASFIYSILVLYDTAKSVFVILDY